MDVFLLEYIVSMALWALVLVVKAFAFLASLRYPAQAYEAGDKWSKPGWCAILGIGLVLHVLFYSNPLNILGLAFTVAALVFTLDVRPALAEVTRRR